MKALQANTNESLTPQVGNMTFAGLTYSKDKTKIKTEYELSDGQHTLQLFFDISSGSADYGFGKIVAKGSTEGVRFEDPQSIENLESYNLTSDDIENAGQDSYDRIEQSNSEESLNFESLFDKIMGNGKQQTL